MAEGSKVDDQSPTALPAAASARPVPGPAAGTTWFGAAASAVAGGGLDVGGVLALQAAAGNAAVARMLRGGMPPRSILLRQAQATAQEPAETPAEPATEEQEEPVMVFEHAGQTHAMTVAEYEEFTAGLVGILRDQHFPILRNRAELLADNHLSLLELNNEHYVIAWFAELFGGAELDPFFLDPMWEMLDAAAAALDDGELTAATDAVAMAELAVNEAIHTFSEYQDKLFKGAGTTITVLDVTQTVAFTVASVAGGAVLVRVGVTAIKAAAISGGGAGLLQSASSNVPKAVAGEQKIGDAALQILIDTGLNAAGAALGAKVAPLVSRKLTDKVTAQFGARLSKTLGAETAVRQAVTDAVEGGLGSAIQGAVADVKGLITGDTTWEQFAEHLALNLAAGAFMGAVTARLKLSIASKRKSLSQEQQAELEQLMKELDEIERIQKERAAPPAARRPATSGPRTGAGSGGRGSSDPAATGQSGAGPTGAGHDATGQGGGAPG